MIKRNCIVIIMILLNLSLVGKTTSKSYRIKIPNFRVENNIKTTDKIKSVEAIFKNSLFEAAQNPPKGIKIIILAKDGSVVRKDDEYPNLIDKKTKLDPAKTLTPSHILIGEIVAEYKKTISIKLKIQDSQTSVICSSLSATIKLNDMNEIKAKCRGIARELLLKLDHSKIKVRYIVKPENISVKIHDLYSEKEADGSKLELELFPGSHTVLVIPEVATEYEKMVDKFNLKRGIRHLEREIILRRKMGTMKLFEPFRNSLLFIDNKIVSPNGDKVSISTGKHNIVSVFENGYVYSKEIEVKSNKITHLRLKDPLLNKYPLINKFEENSEIRGLAANEQRILFVNSMGFVEAINPFNFKRNWVFSKYRVIHNPCIVGKRIFFICEKEHLTLENRKHFFLVEADPKSGRILWESNDLFSDAEGIHINKNEAVFVFKNRLFYISKKIGGKEQYQKPNMLTKVEILGMKHGGFRWKNTKIINSRLLLEEEGRDRTTWVIFINLKKKCYDGQFRFSSGLKSVIVMNNSLIEFNSKSIRVRPIENVDSIQREWQKTTSNEELFDGLSDNKVNFTKDLKNIYLCLDGNRYWNIDTERAVLEGPNFITDSHRFPDDVELFWLPNSQILAHYKGERLIRIFDQKLKCCIWEYDSKAKIKYISISEKYLSIITDYGEFIVFGYPKLTKVAGWVERKNKDNATFVIRACHNKKIMRNIDSLLIANIDDYLSRKIHPEKLRLSIKKLIRSYDHDLMEFQIKDVDNLANIKKGDLVLFKNEISIESKPKNSHAFIGNKLIGNTPISISNLPSKEIDFTLFQKGYEVLTEKISISNDAGYKLKRELNKIRKHTIHIKTIPQNAEVLIDGESINQKKKGFFLLPDLDADQWLNIKIIRNSNKELSDIFQVKANEIEKKSYRVYKLFPGEKFLYFSLLRRRLGASTIVDLLYDQQTKEPIEGGLRRLNGDYPKNAWEAGFQLHVGMIKPLNKLFKNVMLDANFTSNRWFWENGNDDIHIDETELGLKYYLGRKSFLGDTFIGISSYNLFFNDLERRKLQVFFKKYLLASLFIRPTRWANFRLALGLLKRGYFNSSTILKRENGDSFYYYYEADRGWLMELTGAVKVLSIDGMWCTLSGKYTYGFTDFGIASEKTNNISFGFNLEFIGSPY